MKCDMCSEPADEGRCRERCHPIRPGFEAETMAPHGYRAGDSRHRLCRMCHGGFVDRTPD